MATEDDVQTSWENTKADYVRLGSSGLKVSVPILGAMSFGSKEWMPWVIEEQEGMELLKAAYDRGLNTWDTGMFFKLICYHRNCVDTNTSQYLFPRCIRRDHRQDS